MSTIFCPELFPTRRPSGRTQARDAYLRANAGIDPAILAAEMGLSEAFVVNYQIKLGLRKCVATGKRRPL
jgi:hypothetical protein